MENRVEVSRSFGIALVCRVGEVFCKFAFSYVGGVVFIALRVADVFTFQDLVAMGIVPSALICVG